MNATELIQRQLAYYAATERLCQTSVVVWTWSYESQWTNINKIITAWNRVIRKVFNIKYETVGSVSAFIEDKSLIDVIMCRQVRVLKTMSLVGNPVLCNVCFNVVP